MHVKSEHDEIVTEKNKQYSSENVRILKSFFSNDVVALLTTCFYHVTYAFRVNLNSVVPWMSKSFLLGADTIFDIKWLLGNLNSQEAFVITKYQPCSGWAFLGLFTDEEGAKWSPSLKCYTYPTMMNLGTVMPCLKKTQNISYKSRDTYLDFCWYQHFFKGN